MQIVNVNNVEIGAGKLAVLAGPCVAESLDLCLEIAERMKTICRELGLGYIFKASFDKANRSSITSYRGPGLEKGLEHSEYGQMQTRRSGRYRYSRIRPGGRNGGSR